MSSANLELAAKAAFELTGAVSFPINVEPRRKSFGSRTSTPVDEPDSNTTAELTR